MENGSSILIASNELFTQKMLQKTLIKDGYEVLVASNGQEALEILKKHFCPILITDITMPEMDGIELCRKIRKMKFCDPIYFIILTKNTEKATIKDLLDAGADDYLNKPFNQAEILDCLKNKTNNRRGIILSELGFYREALESYKHAVKLNPTDPDIHFDLGLAHYKLENYEETIESFKRVIDLYPDYASAYYNLGLVQSNLGLYEEAITNYKKCIELDPDNANAYYLLGIAQDELGLHGEAIESYQQSYN